MDGENNGKPLLKWMINRENPLFSETHMGKLAKVLKPKYQGESNVWSGVKGSKSPKNDSSFVLYHISLRQ